MRSAGSLKIYVNLGEEASRGAVIEVQTRLLAEPWIRMTTVQSHGGFPSHFMVAVKDSYQDELELVQSKIRETVRSVVKDAEPRFSVWIREERVSEDRIGPSGE
ncbi:hypothetical protein AMJ39_07515 [candidate division TA06 bacterium DG_24]|uniref:Uncharacterized protein n=2 Tax=Bacteria division TA06 TaxID=1156500 RepID=A0A0S8JKF8_UNCT6|nr:MAG: hypothetical protein AMJ39_07515 [candidate division TA06 bacterium DG_24]KPL10120.1 MAG: hypothetical protein AMJ71_04315 [candidate division TA06 bacterium SM1_40]